MSDYKVVFRSDETAGSSPVLWEPGCPVLIEAVQVSRNTETGKAYLQVKVENLTSGIVNGVSVKATIDYSAEPTQELELRELDADIPSGHDYQLKPVELANGDIAKACAVITAVTTLDGNWESKADAQPLPKASKLPLSDKALAERRLRLGPAGDRDDVPRSKPATGDGWWACGCGQLNVGTDTCLRCGTDRATLEETCDNDLLEAWADEREADRVQRAYAEAKELQEKGTAASLEKAVALLETTTGYEDTDARLPECRKALEAAKSRRKGIAKRIVIAIAAIAAAAALWVNVAVPMLAYNEASTEADAGEYQKAMIDFENLGDYRDSKQRATDMKVKYAESLVESGDYTAAISLYKGLGMDDKVKETKYAYCLAHQNCNDTNTYSYLRELGDYQDAQTMLHTIFDPKLEFELVTFGDLIDRGWMHTGSDDDESTRSMQDLIVTYKGGGTPNGDYQFTLKVPPHTSGFSWEVDYEIAPNEGTSTIDWGDRIVNTDRLMSPDHNVAWIGISAGGARNTTLPVKIYLEDDINNDTLVYDRTFNIDENGNLS